MATRGSHTYSYGDSAAQTITTGLGDTLNITNGQAVIVFVSWQITDADPTVTDSAGQTYAPATKRKHSTRNMWVQGFYKLNHPGGSDVSVTADFGEDTPEYRGIGAGNFTVSTGAFVDENWGQVAASATVTTGNLVATGSGVIAAAATLWNSGTYTAGTDFTLRAQGGGINGWEDRLISGAGTYTASITDAGGDDILLAAILIQDEAGSSGIEGTLEATEDDSDTFEASGGVGNNGVRLTLRDTDTGALAAELSGLIVSVRENSDAAALLYSGTHDTTSGGVLEIASTAIGDIGDYRYVTVEMSDHSIVATYRIQVIDLNA